MPLLGDRITGFFGLPLQEQVNALLHSRCCLRRRVVTSSVCLARRGRFWPVKQGGGKERQAKDLLAHQSLHEHLSNGLGDGFRRPAATNQVGQSARQGGHRKSLGGGLSHRGKGGRYAAEYRFLRPSQSSVRFVSPASRLAERDRDQAHTRQ